MNVGNWALMGFQQYVILKAAVWGLALVSLKLHAQKNRRVGCLQVVISSLHVMGLRSGILEIFFVVVVFVTPLLPKQTDVL